MKQCQNCKHVWTGPDQAHPVQDWQSVVQSSPTFSVDWTGLSATPNWVSRDWWNHCTEDKANGAANITADKRLQFQSRLSDAGTEAGTWSLADSECVTLQLGR
jgi:hypothetical protein